MPTYVEVAVNVPKVTDIFHYHLPQHLEGRVLMGHLVVVPFGRRKVHGVVLKCIDQPAVSETKAVIDLVDSEAVLTPHQLELAQYIKKEWLAPIAPCIRLMLPPGLMQQADVLYTSHGHIPDDITENQRRLLQLLERRGPLRGQQIDRVLKHINWRSSVNSLIRRRLLSKKPILPPPRVRPKYVRTAQLACSLQKAEKKMLTLGRPGTKAFSRRQAIIKFLMQEPGPVDVSWVYAESGGNISDLRVLVEKGLVQLGESERWRDPLERIEFDLTEAPTLTSDQAAVWEIIQEQLQIQLGRRSTDPILLHGVTGSGKTEIYLSAIDYVLKNGEQAVVLVPEIALTPQTVRRIAGRFPGQVGLIHSELSDGERYDTWRRARAGGLNVVVGPRSALFIPFKRLGLIVVDECHDDTFYQGDMLPHYHARYAAIAYAQITGSVCLLGSATPDVTSVYQCKRGRWRYLKLPSRILAHREKVRLLNVQIGETESMFRPLEGEAQAVDLPPVSVVDMREELKSGNRSIFSRAMRDSIGQVLKQKQQAILFLNRRGSSTFVFCRDCGYTVKCPRCDLPMTYHSSTDNMICHHCGYKRKKPAVCRNCKSHRIRKYGTGTQKVESELLKIFPGARTLRWDYETTRKKGAHFAILSHFVAHRVDILIGTQMLAKGLDLPLVTLVGVVLADVGLNLPDYRASERTFQVLTQVAGRAGRSPLGGHAVLQTFQPEHYAIQAASRHDYSVFFKQEIAFRRDIEYPPFNRLLRLEYRHIDPVKAERRAQKMSSQIREWLAAENRRATRMIGPAPAYFSRLGGQYRWQIILAGRDPASLLRHRKLNEWRIEVDPPSLL